MRRVTVRTRSAVPAFTRSAAPVGFASGKGKVKEPDEQGSRPSKAPRAAPARHRRAHGRVVDGFVADGERLCGRAR
ncbi:hypothetical protein DMA10_18615 [Streptomyces sp. WAC 01420]|nr:hypothetical protein DLM49_26640 [Streptomyces sp. WAC 01438]RSM94395.1 hypothetical protein DMA10_18615 [Streptomyces sp. WAC 01420]